MIITLYNYISLKEVEIEKETCIYFKVCYSLHSYLTFLIFLLCFYWFKLPSDVISSLWYSFAPYLLLHACIIKCISFLYFIGQTIQLYAYSFIQLLLKLVKRIQEKKSIFLLCSHHGMTVVLVGYLWVSFFLISLLNCLLLLVSH